MIINKLKPITRIILIKSVALLRLIQGKKSKFPMDPHSHLSYSFEISREIESVNSKQINTFDQSNERLDILPSCLYDFKEVIFTPPVLFSSPPIKVHRFKNAQIIGINPIALSESFDLIQENLFRTRDRNRPAITYLSPFELKSLVGFTKQRQGYLKRQGYLSGQFCLLASFWDNFGHWIPEHLLKVNSLIENGFDITKIKFIVRSTPAGFKIDLLKAAGISPNQIIFWNQSFLEVEELLVPSYPQITKERLEWINSLILTESTKSSNEHKIYLSRNNQLHRKIVNEEEVQIVLQRYGFLTIFPEELSFVDQVNLVRKSKILFGPQGSAFTLQIFMPKGHIVEAFPQNRVHLFNRQVAMVLGHKHHILLDPRGPDSTNLADNNLMVDLRLLEEYLYRIIDCTNKK